MMFSQLPTKILFSESKTLLLLAIPLMFAQFADSCFGFFSTIMLAHLGHHALAAGGLVWSLFVTLMVFIWGILNSLSALIAQRHGANDDSGIIQVFKDGLWLALILTIPAMVLLWNVAPILLFFGQQPDTVMAARAYLHGLSWGIFPDFYGIILLQLVIGLGHTRMALVYNFIWVIVGLCCCYIFMFGKWGFKAMGIAGTGWGAVVGLSVGAIFITLHVLCSKKYRHYLSGFRQQKSFCYMQKILKIGVPMSSMLSLELGFFMAIALLMGYMGSQILAANQITLQYVFLFSSVISFGMAQAITVRVGHCIGAKDIVTAERSSYVAVIITIVLMLIAALLFWIFPLFFISIDLNIKSASNQIVISHAKQFLAIAAVFQIMEATRIVSFGALRGLGETRFSMLVSLFTFWCIAFPLGYYLAIHQHWGGSGVWWSMVLGAGCGTMLLIWRFKNMIGSRYG